MLIFFYSWFGSQGEPTRQKREEENRFVWPRMMEFNKKAMVTVLFLLNPIAFYCPPLIDLLGHDGDSVDGGPCDCPKRETVGYVIIEQRIHLLMHTTFC